MRFALHINVFIPKLSLAIKLMRWDIINVDRLAYVILLKLVKQLFHKLKI